MQEQRTGECLWGVCVGWGWAVGQASRAAFFLILLGKRIVIEHRFE